MSTHTGAHILLCSLLCDEVIYSIHQKFYWKKYLPVSCLRLCFAYIFGKNKAVWLLCGISLFLHRCTGVLTNFLTSAPIIWKDET